MKKKTNKKVSAGKFKNKWTVVSVLAIFVFISVIFLPASRNFVKDISSKLSTLADVLSSVLVSETNDFRSTNNENSLVENSLLMSAAQMKADDMAKKGYFSHIAPNGDKPWVWFDKVGYKYSFAGENLAVDFTESSDVTEAWINSAKHKANLLDKNFTEIGIGISKGIYEGHQTIFVVQFFGKPLANNNTEEKGTLTSNLSSETKPDTAVVAKRTLSNGEVLGEQSNNSTQENDQTKWFVISIAGILLILVIFLKVLTVKKEKRY